MKRWSQDWLLLPHRLALHEPSATAVLADLHLGYSAARQRLGDAIPYHSVADEMQPLADAVRSHDIHAVIIAGDLFERGYDADLHRQFLDVLHSLRLELRGLVPGNHDRGIEKASMPMPIFLDGYDLAGWRIVHGDQDVGGDQVVMGHWHPAVRHKGRKTPCFLTRGRQLILPAFSQDAAGVDVRNELRWCDWKCHPISD